VSVLSPSDRYLRLKNDHPNQERVATSAQLMDLLIDCLDLFIDCLFV